MPKITFNRENREIEVPAGTNLRKAAMAEGVQLYRGPAQFLNCHGFSHCGECRVHITKGMENCGPKTLKERFRIWVSWFRIGHENEVRLACQTKVNGDIDVLTRPEFNWFGKRPKRVVAAKE